MDPEDKSRGAISGGGAAVTAVQQGPPGVKREGLVVEPGSARLSSGKEGGGSTPERSTTGGGSSSSQHVDALLPKQTVVKIIGNNRTKSELIGRQGVVKGAQTLGGWHEVLLEHGGFVRVQRNALEVLSMPAISTIPQMVAPLGSSSDRGTVKLEHSQRTDSSHQSPRTAVKMRKSTQSLSSTHVNIDKLDLSSLRRYRRVFNLNVSKDCTRDELVFAVRKHFSRTKVDEHAVIVDFVKRLSRKHGSGPASNGERQKFAGREIDFRRAEI